jgi:hypothetical protein
MSEAYERERQNNARLDELSAKVSALRGVTIDIYDSARSHEVIDSTVCSFITPKPLSLSPPFLRGAIEKRTKENQGTQKCPPNKIHP